MFNIPPTFKVIWRMGHSLRVSSDRLEGQGIKLGTSGYNFWSISTCFVFLSSGGCDKNMNKCQLVCAFVRTYVIITINISKAAT